MKQSLVIIIMIMFAALVFAADIPQPGADKLDESAVTAPILMPSIFQTKINSLMEEEKATIAALEVEFANAPSEAAALQVLKEIEQTKLDTELSLMEFQKNEAQKQGNTLLVLKIEACMEQTRSPRPAGVPQNRSTPAER